MPQFHFLSREHKPGDLIEPGNFGRLLRNHAALVAFGRVVVTEMLCREMLWERMRLVEFKHLPSRLDCVLPERTDADAYGRENNKDGRQILHEVEPIDPKSPTHAAWISRCTMTSGGSFLEQMEPKGHAYWSGQPGDPTQGRELLVKGKIRILRRIS
jgi:hypothetical protein